jgi:heparan-alpha-glucosaminide N-acetyltransferase
VAEYDLVEHGMYTFVVRNNDTAAVAEAPVSAALGFVQDAAGTDRYAAIGGAAGILIGMGIVHRVVGWLLARRAVAAAADADTADDASAAKKAVDSKQVSISRFFGFDKRAARAVKAAAEAGRTPSPGMAQALLSGAEGDGRDSAAAAVAAGADGAAPTAAVAPLPATTKPRTAGRVRAIDTMRGAALCIMIFVNYGGGNYAILDHSRWNGLTLADLVFPLFVWTQGVSMAISFDSARRRGATRWDMAEKVVVRAMKLYAVGLFLNDGTELMVWRVLGVLQYFAVGYLVVGLLDIFVPVLGSTGSQADTGSGAGAGGAASGGSINSPRGADAAAAAAADAGSGSRDGVLAALFRDVGRYGLQWLIMLCFGLVYLCVEYLLPVPGCPTGYIGPGGLADQGLYLDKNCTGGAHRLVDVSIFGVWHIYNNYNPTTGAITSAATCADTYLCDVYDPEGALGWISASWMTFLGLQAGRVLVNYRPVFTKFGLRAGQRAYLTRWIVFGLAFGAVGGGLCGFSKETGLIPINKNMWSPSFVFCMAGIGFLVLSLLYTVVDILKHWSGSPFRYMGMNSIVVYAGSEIFQEYFPLQVRTVCLLCCCFCCCFPMWMGLFLARSLSALLLRLFAVAARRAQTSTRWPTPYRDAQVSYGVTWRNHAEAMASNLAGLLCWNIVARIMYVKGIFVNL